MEHKFSIGKFAPRKRDYLYTCRNSIYSKKFPVEWTKKSCSIYNPTRISRIFWKIENAQNIVIPKIMSEANLSHSPLFLSCEHGKGRFSKLWKFIQKTKIAATIIFSQWWSGEKETLYYGPDALGKFLFILRKNLSPVPSDKFARWFSDLPNFVKAYQTSKTLSSCLRAGQIFVRREIWQIC